MKISTVEEFNAALQKLSEVYETPVEEIQKIVSEKREELKKYYGTQEIPLVNLFMVVKTVLDKRHLTSGSPHLVAVISDSGVFDWVPAELREAYRLYRNSPDEAIAQGLVAGPRHAWVLQGKANVGDPIDPNTGEPQSVRKMRRLEVLAAPLTGEGQLTLKRYVATLWDSDAIKFKVPYLTWIKVKGFVSQSQDKTTGKMIEFFNFGGIDWERIEQNGLPQAYEFVIQNKLLPHVSLSELPSWFQSAEKYVIEAIGVEESVSPVIIEANVVSLDLESKRRVGNKECYRMILMDHFDFECKEQLKVNIPTYMDVNFAEGSRVAVVGRVRPISEDFGGGWQIWQAEAIYPIPGMYFPIAPVETTPAHLGAETEAKGIVKPEAPVTQTPQTPQTAPTPQTQQPSSTQPTTEIPMPQGVVNDSLPQAPEEQKQTPQQQPKINW